jgi:hypothetical protein
MNKYKDTAQMELAMKITGRNKEAIKTVMSRKNLTLAGVVRFYLGNIQHQEDEIQPKESLIGFEASGTLDDQYV